MSLLDKWIYNADSVLFRIQGKEIGPGEYYKIDKPRILEICLDPNLEALVNADKALLSDDGTSTLTKAESLTFLRKWVDSDALPPVVASIGYYSAADDDESETTSTSERFKIDHTFPSVVSGTYKVSFQCHHKSSNKKFPIEIKYIVAGDEVCVRTEESDTVYRDMIYSTDKYLSGSVNVKIEYKASKNNKAVYIKHAKIDLIKVD